MGGPCDGGLGGVEVLHESAVLFAERFVIRVKGCREVLPKPRVLQTLRMERAADAVRGEGRLGFGCLLVALDFLLGIRFALARDEVEVV